MLGGGEEYFAPPKEIDPETLVRFAKLCSRLRRLTKAGQKTVASIAEQCDEVGTTMESKEIVAGLLLRCIRTSTNTPAKQLAYWYIVDQLAKTKPDTFGYLFSLHILDVGSECMPWEDPNVYPKLQALVEHWDGVFPRDMVDRVWQSRLERQWAAKNPVEAAAIRSAEEAKWKELEKQHGEAEGLDQYDQPCLAYLQGRCSWGDRCTQLHPEGAEGSLPAEARLGDWKCPGCGAINRHFRRRCFSCPREKPQYTKGNSTRSIEEQTLSNPDTEALAKLKERWGYNPCDPAQATKYWEERFTHEPLSVFLEARRTKYLESILPAVKESVTKGEAAMLGKKRPMSVPVQGASALQAHRAERGSTVAATAGRAVRMPEVPPELSAPEAVHWICQKVIERGVRDPDFPRYLFLLCKTLPKAVMDPKWSGGASSTQREDSLALHECAKRAFASWSVANASAAADGKSGKPHPATPFFTDLRNVLDALPLTSEHREDIRRMCTAVLQRN